MILSVSWLHFVLMIEPFLEMLIVVLGFFRWVVKTETHWRLSPDFPSTAELNQLSPLMTFTFCEMTHQNCLRNLCNRLAPQRKPSVKREPRQSKRGRYPGTSNQGIFCAPRASTANYLEIFASVCNKSSFLANSISKSAALFLASCLCFSVSRPSIATSRSVISTIFER